MSKKIAPTAPATGITGYPLSTLYLSDLNPRQDTDEAGIELLADSITICGLIQNLAGIEDGTGKVAIVAGGRLDPNRRGIFQPRERGLSRHPIA